MRGWGCCVWIPSFQCCSATQWNYNWISITTDFMISESQALYSALCNTTSAYNRHYQIKLNWQTDNPRSSTESISHLLALLLDCIRTWRVVLKTGVLQYSSMVKSDISICMNTILKHNPLFYWFYQNWSLNW